jgi:hypothetical protein
MAKARTPQRALELVCADAIELLHELQGLLSRQGVALEPRLRAQLELVLVELRGVIQAEGEPA